MSVHWFLSGNNDKPSSRIHGINVHNKLQGKESSFINFLPSKSINDISLTAYEINLVVRRLVKGEVVIIQKLHGANTINLITKLMAKGIKVVYLDCDVPCKLSEAQVSYYVVVTSAFLANEYRNNNINNVIVIPDAAECLKTPYLNKDEVVKCIWFGLPGRQKWNSIMHLKELLSREQDFKCSITTLSYNEESDIKWDSHAYDIINTFDVAVIPIFYNNAEANAKGAVRVVQSMALSLPVVASPIPAYIEVIEEGVTGYICEDEDSWIIKLKQFRDRQHLNQMKRNAYEYANEYYSIDKIVDQWIDFIKMIGGGGPINLVKSNFAQRNLIKRFFNF